MFIPTTLEELKYLNWINLDNSPSLDIILITGDSYIDNSYNGIAIIGKYLIKNGFKVGIISQPSLVNSVDILKFGTPKLFWGITSGTMDSMVSNYTAKNKKRNYDDLTLGGINNKRPDRAVIRYSNLIRQYSKENIPIVIGGIEASLRRVTHYDYWSNKIKKSILLDSKANILVYGEGERTILKLSNYLKKNNLDNIEELLKFRGICFSINHKKSNIIPSNYIELPNFELVKNDKNKFKEMFDIFYANNDPINANGLYQKYQNTYVIQNPPNYYLEGQELDEIYEMDFENDVSHNIEQTPQIIKALETTKFSITTHRGCFGECNFCAINIHFGRKIRSRSIQSIVKEINNFAKKDNFKGIISNIGGATSNMYKMECDIQSKNGSCKNKKCLYPKACSNMNIDHKHYLELIKNVLSIKNINKVFIRSGIRYDLIEFDKKSGNEFLNFIVQNCISGQMKIAPEHIDKDMLNAMNKPQCDLYKFVKKFYEISKKENKKQFLTYYLIAGHPCSNHKFKNNIKKEIEYLQKYFKSHFSTNPKQIQVFTPTPSTYSTLLYYLEQQ